MNKALLLLAAGTVFVVNNQPLRAQELPPASTPPVAAPVKTHHARHHRRHTVRLQAQPSAPIGSPAPSQAEAGTTPAPMPNEDIGPPRAPTDTSASVDPGSLSIHYPPLGNGYLPGSSPQDMANTQTPKVPGVTVNMPLQQAQPQPLPPPAEPAGPAPAPGQ